MNGKQLTSPNYIYTELNKLVFFFKKRKYTRKGKRGIYSKKNTKQFAKPEALT